MLASVLISLACMTTPGARLSEGLPSGSEALLQYDDGSAAWLGWDGGPRGVWFRTGDFFVGNPCFVVEAMEFWFYHHSSYPWDTGSFYAELYSASEQGMPEELLEQSLASAAHYAPVFVEYLPGVSTGADFLGAVNPEVSSGGWPSSLADDTPNFTGNAHSFDSCGWMENSDWLIRAHGEPELELSESTWGGIKALFEW